MPISESTTREYVIRFPDKDGKPGAVFARIVASEKSPQLLLKFESNISYKDFRTGVPMLPIYAKYIGDSLMRAAELAEKVFQQPPPDIT